MCNKLASVGSFPYTPETGMSVDDFAGVAYELTLMTSGSVDLIIAGKVVLVEYGDSKEQIISKITGKKIELDKQFLPDSDKIVIFS